MGSEGEQELVDRWWLGLRGRTLEDVTGHEFTVVLDFGEGSTLTIEAATNIAPTTARDEEIPAVIHHADGTVSTADALLSLIGLRVLSAVGFKTGALRLVFESGRMLTIPFGDQYEAWQLTGPSGRMWVSLPGGGLASFPPASA
jgi:hypothetical protein